MEDNETSADKLQTPMKIVTDLGYYSTDYQWPMWNEIKYYIQGGKLIAGLNFPEQHWST